MNDIALSPVKQALLRRIIEQAAAAETPARAPAIAPRERAEPPPLSPEQQQVWFHAALAGNRPLYNEPITIHRLGSFDLATLEAAFNAVLRRHEIWRTGFRTVDGVVRQFAEAELHVPLPLTDLSGLPPAERETEVLRLATEEAQAPFDLARPPLFRARVFRLTEREHRLHLTLHHIIFDGVSIYRILLPELAAEYAARERGEAGPAPAPALQYGDYAAWRAALPDGEETRRQLAFWRRQLAGGLSVVELPCDRPRPPELTHRGSMAVFTLSGALTAALRALARREGATLYMVLLAGFKALLHRYSGLDDVAVGGVVDTRRRPELERLMGYFLNGIVLRTRPHGETRFRDYLAEVRGAVLDALGNSDVPFDRVVREVQPKRDPARHPLFQILFSMEPPADPFPAGWDLTQMEVTVGIAKFDLYLELDERPDGIIGRFLYSTDLFDAATIGRMIGHWTRLLEAVADHPDTPLAALPLLSEDERRRHAQTAGAGGGFDGALLPRRFAEQTQRTPSREALHFAGGAWTYAELAARAGGVAARLAAEGIGRDALVGLCVERSPEMVAALLGILAAGAAYLPLDPGLPEARLRAMIEDARPAALLAGPGRGDCLPGGNLPVWELDGATGALPPDPAGAPDALAYVLYTSGSTGKPKGVEVTHRGLANLLSSMAVEPGCGAEDVLLAVTPLTFDIAALELFLPLTVGGTVVLADRDTARDPLRLAALVEASRCTIMQATPATWRALLESGWRGRADLKILCGGDTLHRELADRLLPRCASLWNLYGPTETTIWSSLHRVAAEAGPVPIGQPIANTSLDILDAAGNPVPEGVVGELHIGGSGLARGYRHNDAGTRERFVTLPGLLARLYRTGDLARWRIDGAIEFLGRGDNQVKIRGFRIALEEIEDALSLHPDIAAAAVRAWPDPSGERALAAYIVPRGTAPAAADLRRHLGLTLPDYMVPTQFVALPALPLSLHGKIDRKRLPPPAPALSATGFAAPREGTEQQLAAIWSSVLAVETIGRDDDFFALGGHSLLVARLLTRVEAEFGRRLALAAVFHTPTLAGMAALLDAPETAGTQRLHDAGSAPCLLWLDVLPAFRHLGAALAGDLPLIGVPLPTDLPLPHLGAPDFREVAAQLVATIREMQSQGPYRLGGWCTLGILAYETASQLAREGAEVRLVVLLDAVNPAEYRKVGATAVRLSKLRYHWRQFRRLRGAARWQYAAARLSGSTDPVTFRLNPTRTAVLNRSALAYTPDAYAGPVLLARPADRLGILGLAAGWGAVASNLAAIECRGDHLSMLEPGNVAVLAEAIRARGRDAAG